MFSNTKEMEQVFSVAMKSTIDNITEFMEHEIKDEINNEQIGKNGVMYESTGEFHDAWKSTKAVGYNNDFTGKMEYDPDMIHTIDPENFIHGSNEFKVNDVSEFLPNIIFEGKAGKLFGQGFWTEPRDAWTPMLKTTDRNFAKLLKQNLRQYGIKIQRG